MKYRSSGLNVVLIVLTALVFLLAAWNDTHLWIKLVLYLCGFGVVWWLLSRHVPDKPDH